MLWITLLVILGLLVVAALVIYKRNTSHPMGIEPSDQNPSDQRPTTASPSKKYWGKQFVVPIPDNACAAAKELDGPAFALGQTPKLPLGGCDHVGCDCHFVALVDRRTGDERRAGQERREDIRFDDKRSIAVLEPEERMMTITIGITLHR